MNLHPLTIQKLAQALKAELDGSTSVPDLILKPYKHPLGEPSPYVWWLAPAKPRPGVPDFARAKLLVSTRVAEGHVFCGLHVERGYDSPLVPASQRHGRDWAWASTLHDLVAGTPSVTERAVAAAGEPLWVFVAAPPQGGGRHDHVDFSLTVAGLAREDADVSCGELAGADGATDLADLVRRLFDRPPRSTLMHWTDLGIGLACTADRGRPDETPRCAEVLACFGDLLV